MHASQEYQAILYTMRRKARMGSSTMCCKEADKFNKVLPLVISQVTLEGVIVTS